MSWPLPTLLLVLGAGLLVVLALAFRRWWPLSLLRGLALTALLIPAVLTALSLTWSALWWLVQLWWPE